MVVVGRARCVRLEGANPFVFGCGQRLKGENWRVLPLIVEKWIATTMNVGIR
jgi:hypothetical protein